MAMITEVRIKAIILYSWWLTFSFGAISMASFWRNVKPIIQKKGEPHTAGASEGADVSCDETGCEAGTDSGWEPCEVCEGCEAVCNCVSK